ncbi:hydroxyisourate hydrolase [Streptomyces sp. NPDC026659]|uniref:hydroxyisourate hydrolase n=1 Tax=Streptomyces sp. NPDC026659 TaxID=3155123 RepID=UPI0033C54FD4
MPTTSVSTHVLDTAAGRPAAGIAVRLLARAAPDADWRETGTGTTDTDGRCRDLPDPPEGTVWARLDFAVEPYLAEAHAQAGAHEQGPAFFPEVTVTFAVRPGEHYHVPLLLSPFGYSVYRGS